MKPDIDRIFIRASLRKECSWNRPGMVHLNQLATDYPVGGKTWENNRIGEGNWAELEFKGWVLTKAIISDRVKRTRTYILVHTNMCESPTTRLVYISPKTKKLN